MTTAPYGWPALETLHFIGLTLLIGVVLLIDLRMLGVMKNVCFPSLHRLLPWALLGRLPVLCGGSGLYLRTLMQGIASVPDVPVNMKFTASTRPSISCGVLVCTSEWRITTLIASHAPYTVSAIIEITR